MKKTLHKEYEIKRAVKINDVINDRRHKVSTDDEAVAADDNYLRLFQPVQ